MRRASTAWAAIFYACAAVALAEVGESFTIGAYYAMPQLEPRDNFSWDYAFMAAAASVVCMLIITIFCI